MQNLLLALFRWVPVYSDPSQRLAVMSIGFLLSSRDDAVVWRGPKKNGMLHVYNQYQPGLVTRCLASIAAKP